MFISCTWPCLAENYLINGGQASQIDYKMTQEIVPSQGTRKLFVSYVVPQSFTSPSYNQNIETFDVAFSKNPNHRETKTDIRGNKIIKVSWDNPTSPIQINISITAVNNTNLKSLKTRAPFPIRKYATDVGMYLAHTKQAPAGNIRIIRLAQQLTAQATTQFDAVQRILTWIVDHMSYVLRPVSYDALYSLQTGKGNCQNYRDEC